MKYNVFMTIKMGAAPKPPFKRQRRCRGCGRIMTARDRFGINACDACVERQDRIVIGL